MQYFSEYTETKTGKKLTNDGNVWNSQSINDLQGRNEIKTEYPSGEECYLAQEFNTNEYCAGQWCIIKDPATGKWAILLELDHWEFSHFMPYRGKGMGTLGMYKTAKVAKQNARSMWPNAVKVMPKDMTKDIYKEYLEVL